MMHYRKKWPGIYYLLIGEQWNDQNLWISTVTKRMILANKTHRTKSLAYDLVSSLLAPPLVGRLSARIRMISASFDTSFSSFDTDSFDFLGVMMRELVLKLKSVLLSWMESFGSSPLTRFAGEYFSSVGATSAIVLVCVHCSCVSVRFLSFAFR